MAFRPVTGGEALVILASVELALHIVSADELPDMLAKENVL
jgi:hypothetical protein